MSSEQDVTPEVAEAPAPQPGSGRGLSSRWFLIIGAVIVFNIIALIFVPPFPKEGAPGDACAFPVCYINGTLEFPAPARRLGAGRLDPAAGQRAHRLLPEHQLDILTMWIVMAIVLIVVDPDGPRLEAHPGPRPERVRVVLRVPERLRPGHRRPDGATVHPALHRVLPAHPVLQLERSGPADRPDRRAARADERRQHHPRARAGQLHLLRVPGLQAPRLRAATRASSSRCTSSRTGSPPAVSRSSSGSSSSCSNSSSRSRSRCDSSATSTAARSRSASSPR